MSQPNFTHSAQANFIHPRKLLDKHNISPKKSLGQHFVSDPNTIQRILRFAFGDGSATPDLVPDLVIEIGAGLGALTLGLAERAGQVIAIETDSQLLPALREAVGKGAEGSKDSNVEINVKILEGDALTLNFEELVRAANKAPPADHRQADCRLIANLPYNIATRLIVGILQESPAILELTVMVQREVAERFMAKPGDSAFGLLSLKAQFHADIISGGKVSPNVFFPRPAVDSELLKFTRTDKSVANPELIFELAEKAFKKRRKMLRKSLASVANPLHFEAAEISPQSRPQELGIYEWERLASALAIK